MPIMEDVIQGSDAWLHARAGLVTASRMSDVCAKLQNGKPADARKKYLMEVVAGRLTELNTDHFVTPAMQFGLDNEQYAVAAYEMERDVLVDPGGFWVHPTIQWFAASPDRTIGKDGVLECKCPNTTTHLEYLSAGCVPLKYQPQMLAEMACTERKWCDFVSFDPRLPKHLQLFICRLERDNKMIAAIEDEVKKFLSEVDEMLDKLKKF